MANGAVKQDSLESRVHEVLCDQLLMDSIDNTVDLFDEGYLDSMALVNLMMALEHEFEIEIAPEDLEMEDYRNLDRISSMIYRMQSVRVD